MPSSGAGAFASCTRSRRNPHFSRTRIGDDPNILIGDAGRDVADGRGSKGDRCVAETETSCEL
jgi:hypothetical protein